MDDLSEFGAAANPHLIALMTGHTTLFHPFTFMPSLFNLDIMG